jgi:hypothetical protein
MYRAKQLDLLLVQSKVLLYVLRAKQAVLLHLQSITEQNNLFCSLYRAIQLVLLYIYRAKQLVLLYVQSKTICFALCTEKKTTCFALCTT